MYTIDLANIAYDFDQDTATFTFDERDVPEFQTEYEILNPKTGKRKKFTLSHSTGSEFSPDTKWIYKSEDGIIMEIEQDEEMTNKRAEMYLKAKMSH